MDLERAPGPTWPTVLVPRVDAAPPRLPMRQTERLLHIALRTPFEGQPSLAAALRSLACEYADVEWMTAETRGTLVHDVLAAARALKPTLVFMQLQRRTPITPAIVESLRVISPDAVIVNWDGDQHHEPASAERAWFVELGKVCDASLVVNTRHPAEYAAMGVRHPGYLQIGVDDRYRPTAPAKGVPRVVLLASNYATHRSRVELVRSLTETLGPREFGVYGGGWNGAPAARPMLHQDEEPPVYAGTRAAISMSIRADLPRYTSDRLFRALASGALVFVERFPECETLGLRDGENCRLWSDWDELKALVTAPTAPEEQELALRMNAAQLTRRYHTWHARMGELLAIVDAVRGDR